MNKIANVCIAGKNNIAVEVLKYLIAINNGRYDICVICNKDRGEILYFQKSLRECAIKNNISIVSLDDVYTYNDLIFISLEYDKIVNPSKFKDARLYNIHFSLLPAYKGMYTSAIPILNGEAYSGVTFHVIDEGIDTGDIIAQKKIEIEKTDTCRDLYQKYITNGIELVEEVIEDVLLNRETTVRQTATGASYYPKGYIDYSNLKLNFKNVAENVERQVRAYSFREYQMPKFNETDIISCEITDTRSSTKVGTMLKETDSLYEVSTIDYNIRLFKDRTEELFESCKRGDLALVREICQVKAHLGVQNIYGWTPLIIATYNNHIDIVRYLIEAGADITMTNYNGTNLLMYAKEAYKTFGDRALFDLFKDVGMDLSEKDDYGYDVRDYIIKDGLEELL